MHRLAKLGANDPATNSKRIRESGTFNNAVHYASPWSSHFLTSEAILFNGSGGRVEWWSQALKQKYLVRTPRSVPASTYLAHQLFLPSNDHFKCLLHRCPYKQLTTWPPSFWLLLLTFAEDAYWKLEISKIWRMIRIWGQKRDYL